MKRKSIIFMTLLLGLFVLFGFDSQTQAATNVKNLKKNVTYTTKFTGTANYKVQYKEKAIKSGSKYKNLQIYVGGKLKKEVKRTSVLSYRVQLLKINEKRTLLAITDQQVNGYIQFMNVYEYKNGKFVFLANFVGQTRSTSGKANKVLTPWARGYIKSVSGTKILVRWYDSTNVTGNISYNITYQVKGNKITKSGVSHQIRESSKTSGNPKWTSKFNYTTYTAAGGKKKAFSVKKGDKLTLKETTVKNGKRYIKLVNSKGKSGWIVNPVVTEKNRLGGYFWECFFAVKVS